MTSRIIDFISILRKSNIRISMSESIDACKSLKIINEDLFNRDIFKHTLKSTLIKNLDDEKVFNQIFDLYFIEPIEDIKQEISNEDFDSIWEQQLNNSFEEFEQIQSDDSKWENEGPNDNDEKFFNNINTIDKEKLIKDMYLRGSESEIEQFSKDQIDQINIDDCKDILSADQIVNAIMNKNKMDIIKKNTKDELSKKNQKSVEEKYDQIKEKIKEQLLKKMVEKYGSTIINEIVDSEDITEKDIGSLNFEELQKVQEIVKKMAKKIMVKQSRKEKISKKGRVDIKGTIKRSITEGTICSNLQFKKRKNTKNNLVVLCDISGSVYLYVDFMLQMTLGIKKSFKNVQTYVFVDKIKNINYILDKEPESINAELEKIVFGGSLGYATDYTNSFREFLGEDNILNKNTILIIMGDAENTNIEDKGYKEFKQISSLCKATYWLNPKQKENWYNGISCLEEYKKNCTNVFECSTIKQLEQFIKNIIKIK